MDNDGYISNGELFQVLAMKSTKDTHKKTFSFAASFIFVLPRCWRWWWETTWKTPSCSRWSIYHITCTCRFFVWKLKKGYNSKKWRPCFVSQRLPFFRLWTRQFSSTTRTTPARSTSRSFARSIFFGCTNLKIFAGGWKHRYSHEDGCGGVSWHLRVRG